MPPIQIGYGPMGLGLRTGGSHIAWEIDGVKLGVNASSLRVTEEDGGRIFKGLGSKKKILYGHAPGDPRVAGRYHIIEMNFVGVNHELVQLILERANFFGGTLALKLYQYDFRDIGVGGSDKYDAARMMPATPGASSCATWFWPLRGISNDSGDGPTLYKNGTLVSAGLTWDYLEASVTFTTIPNTTDVIRSYGIWKPRVRIDASQTQIVPRVGKIRGKELYDIQVTAIEL